VDITAPIASPDAVVPSPRSAELPGTPAAVGAAAAPLLTPVAPPSATAVPPPAADSTAGSTPRRERRSRRRTDRRLLVAIVIVAALVLATVVWAGTRRIDQPLAVPTLRSGVPGTVLVPGTSPALPWPTRGQGAVAIPALGYAAQSGPESSQPIASLTKMTTALVVLRDHPVPAGAAGPSVTITDADVAEYDYELHNDESTVPIHTGEVLSERAMLEALLTQSANDVAYSLALWDAGSLPAFVAKMNAAAVGLGTTGTHYVDASGYDPGSVSTASDVTRIAAVAMLIPTFAQVVAMPTIDFPGVGTVANVVSEIGQNGIIGVKSGYTSEAGGCMVLAADRVIDGQSVLVLAAVLGQPTPPPVVPATTTTTRPAPTTTTAPGPPAAAAPAAPAASAPAPTTSTAPPTGPTSTTTTTPVDDLEVPDPLKYTGPVTESLLQGAQAGVVAVTVAEQGAVVGTASTEWGDLAHRVAVVSGRTATVLGWPGQQVATSTTLHRVRPGGSRGSAVGTARFTLGTQSESVPLLLASTVPEPSWWWRLLHS